MKLCLALLLSPVAGAASAETPSDNWAQIGRYANKNARQIASRQKPDIVLLGDSITEAGRRSVSTCSRRSDSINRGISAQTTPQLLVSFREEVSAL